MAIQDMMSAITAQIGTIPEGAELQSEQGVITALYAAFQQIHNTNAQLAVEAQRKTALEEEVQKLKSSNREMQRAKEKIESELQQMKEDGMEGKAHNGKGLADLISHKGLVQGEKFGGTIKPTEFRSWACAIKTTVRAKDREVARLMEKAEAKVGDVDGLEDGELQ